MTTAATIAVATAEAYMRDTVTADTWLQWINDLLGAGYHGDAVTWIMNSKVVRWAVDGEESPLTFVRRLQPGTIGKWMSEEA